MKNFQEKLNKIKKAFYEDSGWRSDLDSNKLMGPGHGRYVGYEVPELEEMIQDYNTGIEDKVYEAFYIGTGYGLQAIEGDGNVDDIIERLLQGNAYEDDAIYEAYRRGLDQKDIVGNVHSGEC